MKLISNQSVFDQAQTLFPGGVNSPVRAFRHVGLSPKVMVRGRGSRVWDANGQAYIDYCGAWGSLIHGHAPAAVGRAVIARVKQGTSFGAPTVEENQLGALVRDLMPSLERLRFVSSGTEAVMSALRLARAFTGRSLIVKFDGCYHGHSDQLLVRAGSGLADAALPDSAGVTADQTANVLSLPYNDLTAVELLFGQRGLQIAAVIVEPVAANMGLVLPRPEFLASLRTLTSQAGSLLIFDEVITGFRVALGGAQAHFGIRPDLTTIGKIVGGGFPAAAYGGRAEIMKLVAPEGPMYQAGTLSGNPVAMVAGYQTLKTLAQPGVHRELLSRAQEFTGQVRELCQTFGWSVTALGTMFTIFFAQQSPANFAEVVASRSALFGPWYRFLLSQGIYLAPSPFETNFISTAHSQRDLTRTMATLNQGFEQLAASEVTHG